MQSFIVLSLLLAISEAGGEKEGKEEGEGRRAGEEVEDDDDPEDDEDLELDDYENAGARFHTYTHSPTLCLSLARTHTHHLCVCAVPYL